MTANYIAVAPSGARLQGVKELASWEVAQLTAQGFTFIRYKHAPRVSITQPLGSVHTFFILADATAFQRTLAGYGYNARVRITGRQSYSVHILSMME